MDLTTAGMISGAGNAVSKVADQVLAIGGQSILQKERQDWEDKRAEQTEKFAADREQRGYKHAEGLLAQREAGDDRRLGKTQEFALGQDQQRLGADLTKTKLGQAYESGEHAKERTSKEGMHSADLKSKEGLAKQELDMKSKYYDALGRYYSERGTAALSKAAGKAGESPDDKKQKEYLESVTKPLIDNLTKQMEFAGPDEKDEIRSRLDHVIEEARRVANINVPDAPAPGQINDRFAKPAVTGGR